MHPLNSAAPVKGLLSLPESAMTRNSFQFNPQDDTWFIADLSKDFSLSFNQFYDYCDADLIQALKKVLVYYLEHKSSTVSFNVYHHFKRFIRIISTDTPEHLLSSINSTHIINYKATLSSRTEYYLTYLAGFFKKWHALGYPGIQPEVPALLNVPRAKQRGQNIREELKSRALDHDLGRLLEVHIENIKKYYRENLTDKVDAEELPIFPNWMSSNPVGFSHHCNGTYLYNEIARIFQKLKVTSERTGKRIKVSPTRFRRTIGTRAAMEGHGELIIADLLDHSDIQNVGVYVEATPEIIARIDKALALQLAPMAQAFMGIIIEDESKAKRGDDPASRIRSPDIATPKGGGVGTCGKYGFCGAYAPIACYTCRKFQAWLDGPHEIVLEELISKRERTLEQTGDERIAFVNDRTILAVADVIRKCKEIKRKGVDHA